MVFFDFKKLFDLKGTDCRRLANFDGTKVKVETANLSLEVTELVREIDPQLLKAFMTRLLVLDDFQYVICTYVRSMDELLSQEERYRLLRQMEQANVRLQYLITVFGSLSNMSKEQGEQMLRSSQESVDEFLHLSGISDSVLNIGPKLTIERERIEAKLKDALHFEKKDQDVPYTQIETPKRGNINVFLTKQAVLKRTRAIQDEISKIPGVVGVWYTNRTNAMLVDVVTNSYEQASNIESRIRAIEGVDLTQSTFAKPSKSTG